MLDEVDRLPRRTVHLARLLLKRAPGNLHVALAFRVNPGLELATHLLDGGAVVGADTLRFSTADIERFFDRTLSEEELAGVEERTAGWPVALVGGADHLLPADLDSRLPAGNLADERGRTLACAWHTLLCVACFERARFEESRRHGLQAQACSTEDTRFGEVFVGTCLGMAAMAQGRVEEAGFALRELPVTAPWTMKLDPDERLTDHLKASISAWTSAGAAGPAGLSFDRRLHFMGRPLPVRRRVVRVWRTGFCRFTDATVNEHPVVDGAVRHIAGFLEHLDSPDLDHWLEKQNRYTAAEALAAYTRGIPGRDARPGRPDPRVSQRD